VFPSHYLNIRPVFTEQTRGIIGIDAVEFFIIPFDITMNLLSPSNLIIAVFI